MLQLYDVNKIKVQGLTKYKDYKIESVLESGDKTLSFSYPSSLSKSILEECYIRNEADEFVIKEIKDDGKWKSVVAVMNVEELEGQAWEHFNFTNITVKECLTLIVAGTGWNVEVVDNISKKRTVKKTNCSSWNLIQEVKKSYRVEIEFDTLNKVIKVYEKIGSNKGSYFIDTLNLKELELETDSYDYYTKIIAIGKGDIKVEVENYQYSNKVKTLIWKDEKYTDGDSLREDAILKLNEISKPRKSYRASIIDLARLSDKYRDILEYKLGDVVTLISKDLKVKDKQRIVKITEYPDDPSKNACEMSNTTLSFKELQKEFKDTSSTVSNITEDNGKISEKAIKEAVDKITIDKADIESLNVAEGRIGVLETTTAKISDLTAINSNIQNLQADKANITDLTATKIKFDVASGDTLDLQTLLSKFITSENGQFLNITSNNTTISNAVIKDAMIDSISAGKINTGVLNTNLVNIQGNNGNLLIKDNTIQIKDGTRARVQIGKDDSDDYSMYVWDSTGKLMFDATGLKADGIKNSIIRNDMISDNANINGKKIDINSLVTEVNKDTNTTLMKASKIALDTTGQSLEISFDSLKTSSDDTKRKTESNTTEIGVINGQIDTLIKDTTIDEDGSTIKLKDSYSSLKQTVNGINTTVASHETSITNLGTNVTNAQNTANNANSLADSKAKVFTSTPVTPYKVGDIWTGGPSGEIMKCKVTRASGIYVASDWEKASKYTDDTKANAVEGNLNTLSGKVTTVENKQATLEQSLDGFKTTVTNTYSTKSEMLSVDGRVTNLNSRVSTAESSITQLNNQIDLKVEKTDVTNAINEIQVGGTNLVSSTKMEKSWLAWNDKGISTLTSEGTRLVSTATGQNAIVSSLTIIPKIDDIFTLTFRARGNLTALEVYLLATSGTNEREYYAVDASKVINTNTFSEVKVTFTFKNSNTNPTTRLFIGGQFNTIGQWLEVEKESVKLERGNKATSWEPATEDTEEAISTIDSKITTTNNKVASIETNLSSITSRVSSTESNISTINNNVTSLQSRMSTAESKITDSAIVSTVQSTINNAKTDAINSANTNTSNLLKGYSTTAQMNSAITQTANSVKTEVSSNYLSKSDATNTYTTKANMELTSNQLKLSFSSSGGANLIRNGNFKNGTKYWWQGQYNLGGTGQGISLVDDSSEWVLDNRVAACLRGTNITGEYRLESAKFPVKKNMNYTVSMLVASHRTSNVGIYVRGNEWDILSSTGENIYSQGYTGGKSIGKWKKFVLHFNSGDNYQANINLIVFNSQNDSYTWFTDVMVNEGDLEIPFITHQEEIVNANTIIDGDGVTVNNGALTVKNNNNVVCIDGKYNTFKIYLTGIINVKFDSSQTISTSASAQIYHNFGYQPAFQCYVEGDNGYIFDFPYIEYVNQSGAFHGLGTYGRTWSNKSILEIVFRRPNDLGGSSRTLRVRYYIFKEVAM